MPYISCVVTAYSEGNAARTAIESLLSQTFKDFEIVIVDDGADQATRRILNEYQDTRIKYLRQANDGLSSARNRGLKHCNGDYVCFLDADDMRPAWAFERMAVTARNTDADCVFCRGMLSELRNETLPFYDTHIFDILQKTPVTNADQIENSLYLLMLLEPQSANKCIKRKFLEESNLAFPNGLFFEDMIFHMGLISKLNSFALVQIPSFTYFRRYGRPQITSGSGLNRLDSISMSFMALDMFSRSERFRQQPKLGIALVLSLFKLIKWCNECISHIHRYHFQVAVTQKLRTVHPDYFKLMKSKECQELVAMISWSGPVLKYFQEFEKRCSS